jgi:hypothetical protein
VWVVTGLPSSTTAGAAQTFPLTAMDAYGNVATNYTGTVTFSSSDPLAALPANYTFTTADAGVHTFTATLKKAGTQSITATDVRTSNLSGLETGIAVSPAAVTHFLISGPTSVTQGVGFKLTVSAVDAFGNVNPGYRGAVHLSSTDATGGTQTHFCADKTPGRPDNHRPGRDRLWGKLYFCTPKVFCPSRKVRRRAEQQGLPDTE